MISIGHDFLNLFIVEKGQLFQSLFGCTVYVDRITLQFAELIIPFLDVSFFSPVLNRLGEDKLSEVLFPFPGLLCHHLSGRHHGNNSHHQTP